MTKSSVKKPKRKAEVGGNEVRGGERVRLLREKVKDKWGRRKEKMCVRPSFPLDFYDGVEGMRVEEGREVGNDRGGGKKAG